ncbi:hypothetical protein ACLOJK_004913 [Asimina triloba]
MKNPVAERERGKGKAPSASGESSTARPRARRAPTNANKLDQVIERVVKSRMAQEAIRLELISKLESLQRSVADIAAFVIKINEKQALQDAEMTFLRRRLEALQTQPKETSLKKRKAETSPDVLEQLRKEAEIRQPVTVSKRRPTYPDPEDEKSVEEISPQEEGPKEPPVALESNSGTNFTIPNPPSLTPEKTVPLTPSAKPTWLLTETLHETIHLKGRITKGNPAPVNEPHRDLESENFRNDGAAGPSRNPGRRQGPTLHERLTQQETQFQSFAERVLTQLDVLQRRLDRNPQQQRSEGVVQGQAIYGDHSVERLPRKGQDRKDANVFHQQHPPSFSGEDNTEAENWLLAINKILEFLDCPD